MDALLFLLRVWRDCAREENAARSSVVNYGLYGGNSSGGSSSGSSSRTSSRTSSRASNRYRNTDRAEQSVAADNGHRA